jgi:MarR family transcriptional regulator for hemolysin
VIGMLEDKDIGFILHRAAMSAKCKYSCKLNEFGITPGQFMVLKEVFNHQAETDESGISPAGIAERLQFDRPTVTGIIDRLEAQEWAERVINPKDKRSCLIKITGKALEGLKLLEEINIENQNKILNGFKEEEKTSFKNYLLRVIENFIEPQDN